MNINFRYISDAELDRIYTAYRSEKDRRNLNRLESGDYLELNDHEKSLISDSVVPAIVAYRKRTGYDLMFCKMVVEKNK